MGIITEYSKYWLIVIAIASFGLTYYFYKDQHWINAFSKKLKVTLFSLRFTGLFFCLLLLLGLFLESIQYRDEKPLLITIIDNSSSMKNYSDSSKLKSSISNFKNNVTESVKNKMELVNYTIVEFVECHQKQLNHRCNQRVTNQLDVALNPQSPLLKDVFYHCIWKLKFSFFFKSSKQVLIISLSEITPNARIKINKGIGFLTFGIQTTIWLFE